MKNLVSDPFSILLSVAILAVGLVFLIIGIFTGVSRIFVVSIFVSFAPAIFLIHNATHGQNSHLVPTKLRYYAFVTTIIILPGLNIDFLYQSQSRTIYSIIGFGMLFISLIFSSTYYTRSPSRLLFFISTLSIFSFWISLWNSYPVIGGDTFYHLRLVELIEKEGTIPYGSEYIYQDFPVYFISNHISMIVTGLSYKQSITITIILPMSVLLVAASFAIGKKFMQPNLAISLSTIIASFPFLMWYVYQMAPVTYGINLILGILIFVFERLEKYQKLFLFVVFCTSLAFTHALTTGMLLVLLIGTTGFEIVTKRKQILNGEVGFTKPGIATIFVVIFLSKWATSGWNLIGRATEIIYSLFLSISYIYTGEGSESGRVTGGGLTHSEIFSETLFSFPLNMLLFLFLFGLLIIARERDLNRDMWKIVFSSSLFTGFAMFANATSVVGISGLIPFRWLGLMALLLIPFIYVSLSDIPISISTILIVVIIILSVAHPISSIDNPTYSEEESIRWALTHEEVSTAEWTTDYGRTIYADSSYIIYFRYLSPDQDTTGSRLTIVREYIFHRSFYGNKQEVFNPVNERVSPLVRLSAKEKKYIRERVKLENKIYSSGSVNVTSSQGSIVNMSDI